MNREARMGMIGLAVIVLTGWLITYLTNVQRQKQFGTPYHVIFYRIEGLEQGCKVLYSGRMVGRVRTLEVRPGDQRVDVTISISPLAGNVVLTKESTYSIEGGIWGERTLNIAYQPGTVVPPGGEVQGIGVPRLSHIIRHGLGLLDELQAMVGEYQGKMGNIDQATAKAKKVVKHYNDLAFEARVQANRFNKFAGLIDSQLDEVVVKMDTRVKGLSHRAAMSASQMRLYVRSVESAAVARDRSLHATLLAFHRRLLSAMQPLQGFRHAVESQDEQARATVRRLREKMENIRDIAETLRLVSSNPRLKQQFRQMTGNLATRLHAIRQMLREAREGKPSATPLPEVTVPEIEPSPVPQPAGPAVPVAPGVPKPPEGPSTGSGPRPRPRTPMPLPTLQAP